MHLNMKIADNMEVRAVSMGRGLKVQKIKKKYENKLVSKGHYFLVRPEKNKYMVFLTFGVIVFWGYDEKNVSAMIGQIRPYFISPKKAVTKESISCFLQGNSDEVDQNEIILQELSEDKIGLVSEVIGRSVALENYEKQLDLFFDDFDAMIENFATTGKINVPKKELLKKAAFAMQVRNAAMNRINLLDSPDLTWEDDKLYDFYRDLLEEYELEDRYKLLQQRLNAIYRDVEFIMDLLNTKKSHLLEWIIIWLILFEVLVFLYESWFV